MDSPFHSRYKAYRARIPRAKLWLQVMPKMEGQIDHSHRRKESVAILGIVSEIPNESAPRASLVSPDSPPPSGPQPRKIAERIFHVGKAVFLVVRIFESYVGIALARRARLL